MGGNRYVCHHSQHGYENEGSLLYPFRRHSPKRLLYLDPDLLNTAEHCSDASDNWRGPHPACAIEGEWQKCEPCEEEARGVPKRECYGYRP